MQNYSKRERGQSFVELGVSMVFLLILLAAVMDLGRVIFTYIAIRDAVQEGAAYAAINPSDCSGIVNRIRTHTSGAVELTDTTGIQVDVLLDVDQRLPSLTDDHESFVACSALTSTQIQNLCPGNPIKVSLQYNNFQIAAPLVGAFIGTQSVSFGANVTDTVVVNPADNSCP